MKKVIAAILLLSHMNTSMFLPQVQEDDVFTASGQQVDDINSLVELINVELGYDKTADDEDDDSGQNFHLVKAFDYNFEQQQILLNPEDFVPVKRHEFAEFKIASPAAVCLDIPTPPPDLSRSPFFLTC